MSYLTGREGRAGQEPACSRLFASQNTPRGALISQPHVRHRQSPSRRDSLKYIKYYAASTITAQQMHCSNLVSDSAISGSFCSYRHTQLSWISSRSASRGTISSWAMASSNRTIRTAACRYEGSLLIGLGPGTGPQCKHLDMQSVRAGQVRILQHCARCRDTEDLRGVPRCCFPKDSMINPHPLNVAATLLKILNRMSWLLPSTTSGQLRKSTFWSSLGSTSSARIT